MQSFVRLWAEWFIYFQVEGEWIKQAQRLPRALNPILPHLLQPARNINRFFSPLQMKMIVLHHLLRSWWLCEGGSAESLSLSCHSLERHVNSTYRLLGGVTHRRRDNLICGAFSPRLEHIYTQPLIEIATPDWIFGRASLERRAPGHCVAAPLLRVAPDIFLFILTKIHGILSW